MNTGRLNSLFFISSLTFSDILIILINQILINTKIIK